MANTMELQLKLRVQEKMLMKEAQREEKNANKERNKAKAALKKGNREFARVYAENAIRSQNNAIFLQQNAAKVSSMVVDLKMAEVQAKMAKSLDMCVKELEKSVGSMDLTKIAAATLKYDQIRGKVSEGMSIINAADVQVQNESEDILGDLENEILLEMDQAIDIPMAEIPQGQATVQKPGLSAV